MILAKRKEVPSERSILVGITGIDGSGKGYVTDKVTTYLQGQVGRTVIINIDGWLNLPGRRFNPHSPAQHFYDHGIRLDEMFQQLVLPLKEKRSHRLVADLADATNSDTFRRHEYRFADISIILVEGIFLLKRAYRDYFDLAFWVDCTFETALERALQRGQEGLPPEETVRAYETVYFPAQRLHLAKDDPRSAASAVIFNDPRISRDCV